MKTRERTEAYFMLSSICFLSGPSRDQNVKQLKQLHQSTVMAGKRCHIYHYINISVNIRVLKPKILEILMDIDLCEKPALILQK